MRITKLFSIMLGLLVLTSGFVYANPGELVIYSGRNERFVLPVIQKFEQETGIKVRLLSGDATNFGHRLVEEARRPQADLLLANDAGLMEFLRLKRVLAPITSSRVTDIPVDLRAEDNSWIALSARSRVLMYNPELISEEEMPKSIFDLADPKYKGQFAITRSGNGSMISHIAAIRAFAGDEKTIDLIKRILANDPVITPGHGHIRRIVGSGEVKFGLVNNYYFHQQLEEERDNNVAAIYPDQAEGQMGVFVNIAGIGLVKGSPNAANAQRFVDFCLVPEQQRLFSYASLETPVVAGIEAVSYAKRIDEYRRMDMPLSKLGAVWADSIDLMERAGYTE